MAFMEFFLWTFDATAPLKNMATDYNLPVPLVVVWRITSGLAEKWPRGSVRNLEFVSKISPNSNIWLQTMGYNQNITKISPKYNHGLSFFHLMLVWFPQPMHLYGTSVGLVFTQPQDGQQNLNTSSTCHESHRSSSSEVSGLTAAKNLMLSHERVTLWFFNMAMEHGQFIDDSWWTRY